MYFSLHLKIKLLFFLIFIGSNSSFGQITYKIKEGQLSVYGGYYQDPGGKYDYKNNLDVTQTIYPREEGKGIQINFTDFHLQHNDRDFRNRDYLYIYDGEDKNAPLIGAFSGTLSPFTVNATNAKGALTLNFTSDKKDDGSGWEASLSSISLPPSNFTTKLEKQGSISIVHLSWEEPSYKPIILEWSRNPSFSTRIQSVLPGGTKTYQHKNLKDTTTYFYRIKTKNSAFSPLIWVVNPDINGKIGGIPRQEYDALVALYISTNGENWRNHDNWFQGNVKNWKGIRAYNSIIGIDLKFNHLSGYIPPQIGQLTKLNELDLSYNKISGPIPAEIGQLTKLYILTLNSNKIIGHIPPELGQTILGYLDLSHNEITGIIPKELGNPPWFNDLDLSHNKLTGQIPVELRELNELTSLDLRENNLSGEIPAEIGELTNLLYLHLDANNFSGTLPVEIGQLKKLRELGVSYNHFNYIPKLPYPSNRYFFVNHNDLGFESLQNNLQWKNHPSSGYKPQNEAPLVFKWIDKVRKKFSLTVKVDGKGNSYQWYADDKIIRGAVESIYIGKIEEANLNSSLKCNI